MKIEVNNPLHILTITICGVGLSITYHTEILTREVHFTLTWGIGKVEFKWTRLK